jgi:two-component system chemotaxis response regulator CheY
MLNALVVDDSLIIRRNISKMLAELGHKVVAEAVNGLEAIRYCENYSPDLITMDITMPDMDGITAVRAIKKVNRYVKIIMITSHGQEIMVKDAIRAGASGYLLKPINIDKLSQVLDKVFPELKAIRESISIELDTMEPLDKMTDVEDIDLTINDE